MSRKYAAPCPLLAWLVLLAAVLTSNTALAQPSAPDATATPPESTGVAQLRGLLQPVPGGLTAESAARRALEIAPMIRRAELGHEAALEAAAETRAAFVPAVALTASYTRLSEMDLPPISFVPGAPPVDNPFPQILNMYMLRSSVTLPVSDYFLSILPAYRGVSTLAQAAEEQVTLQEEQTAARARETFYGYIQARGSVRVAEQAVATLERAVRDAEALVAAGVMPRADALQLRARLESARAGKATAEGGVATLERVLRRMLSLDDRAPVEIGEDLFEPVEEDARTDAELLATAMQDRPEARALRALVRGREFLADSRRGALYPHLAVVGSVDYSRPNSRIFPQHEEFDLSWTATVAASWTPTDLVGKVHSVRQAESEIAQAREDLASLEDGVAIEVTRARSRAHSVRAATAAAERALEAAQAALSDRQQLLAAGTATASEFAASQLELTQAQLALVNAHVEQHVAAAALRRALGRARPELAPSENAP